MQAVWPDAFVTDDSLVQCTVELRRALDDRTQKVLKTVSRRGYIFTAAVIQCPSKTNEFSTTGSLDLSGSLLNGGGLSPVDVFTGVPPHLPLPRTSLI